MKGQGAVSSKGLRYKLFLAFCLMSFIPLLVIVYLLANFIFPTIDSMTIMGVTVIIVLCTLLIALLGLVLTKRLIEPVIEMAIQARMIAGGQYNRKLDIDGEDEIADLGRSINVMTRKIKDYLVELQNYSTKTKEVNIDIQKKVVMLSSLLQISDMIATSEKLETVIDMIAQKVNEIGDEGFTAIYLAKEGTVDMERKASVNVRSRAVKGLTFRVDKDYIGTSVRGRMTVKIDSQTGMTPQLEGVRKLFKATNCLIIPVVSHGRGVGFLITGNSKEGFVFSPEDVELIKVLSKQLCIAIENVALMKRTRELVVKDELTGLYNEKYIKERLDEEIQRSILYQRPCSLLLFNIDDFNEFRDSHGEMVTEEALKKIASILRETSAGITKVARLGGDEFAMVLSEMNKKQAADLAEEIRKKVEVLGRKIAGKGGRRLTISGSVSENPIDGSSARELFEKAGKAMDIVKAGGKNSIGVSKETE
jgi:diguanylate cyclase (GGDEF)-like protein